MKTWMKPIVVPGDLVTPQAKSMIKVDFFSKYKPVLLPFGKTIYQSPNGQSVTSDTAFIVETVLQEFPNLEADVLELGSGNGIISVMLKNYRKKWEMTGLEIQPQLAELSQQNAELMQFEIDFRNGDLKDFAAPDKFDMIVSNPPYFPVQDGRISPIEERAISRHEINCNMRDVLNSVKNNLKHSGVAFLIYPESRWKDLELFVKKVDLIVERKFISKADTKRIFVAKIVYEKDSHLTRKGA